MGNCQSDAQGAEAAAQQSRTLRDGDGQGKGNGPGNGQGNGVHDGDGDGDGDGTRTPLASSKQRLIGVNRSLVDWEKQQVQLQLQLQRPMWRRDTEALNGRDGDEGRGQGRSDPNSPSDQTAETHPETPCPFDNDTSVAVSVEGEEVSEPSSPKQLVSILASLPRKLSSQSLQEHEFENEESGWNEDEQNGSHNCQNRSEYSQDEDNRDDDSEGADGSYDRTSASASAFASASSVGSFAGPSFLMMDLMETGEDDYCIPEEVDPDAPSDEEESFQRQTAHRGRRNSSDDFKDWEMEPGPLPILPISDGRATRSRGFSPPRPQTSVKLRYAKVTRPHSIVHHTPSPQPLHLSTSANKHKTASDNDDIDGATHHENITASGGNSQALYHSQQTPLFKSSRTAVDRHTLAAFNKLQVQIKLANHQERVQRRAAKFEDRYEDVRGYRTLMNEFRAIQQKLKEGPSADHNYQQEAPAAHPQDPLAPQKTQPEGYPQKDRHDKHAFHRRSLRTRPRRRHSARFSSQNSLDHTTDTNSKNDGPRLTRSRSFDLKDTSTWFFNFEQLEDEEVDDNASVGSTQSSLSLLSAASMERQRKFFESKSRARRDFSSDLPLSAIHPPAQQRPLQIPTPPPPAEMTEAATNEAKKDTIAPVVRTSPAVSPDRESLGVAKSPESKPIQEIFRDSPIHQPNQDERGMPLADDTTGDKSKGDDASNDTAPKADELTSKQQRQSHTPTRLSVKKFMVSPVGIFKRKSNKSTAHSSTSTETAAADTTGKDDDSKKRKKKTKKKTKRSRFKVASSRATDDSADDFNQSNDRDADSISANVTINTSLAIADHVMAMQRSLVSLRDEMDFNAPPSSTAAVNRGDNGDNAQKRDAILPEPPTAVPPRVRRYSFSEFSVNSNLTTDDTDTASAAGGVGLSIDADNDYQVTRRRRLASFDSNDAHNIQGRLLLKSATAPPQQQQQNFPFTDSLAGVGPLPTQQLSSSSGTKMNVNVLGCTEGAGGDDPPKTGLDTMHPVVIFSRAIRNANRQTEDGNDVESEFELANQPKIARAPRELEAEEDDGQNSEICMEEVRLASQRLRASKKMKSAAVTSAAVTSSEGITTPTKAGGGSSFSSPKEPKQQQPQTPEKQQPQTPRQDFSFIRQMSTQDFLRMSEHSTSVLPSASLSHSVPGASSSSSPPLVPPAASNHNRSRRVGQGSDQSLDARKLNFQDGNIGYNSNRNKSVIADGTPVRANTTSSSSNNTDHRHRASSPPSVVRSHRAVSATVVAPKTPGHNHFRQGDDLTSRSTNPREEMPQKQ